MGELMLAFVDSLMAGIGYVLRAVFLSGLGLAVSCGCLLYTSDAADE